MGAEVLRIHGMEGGGGKVILLTIPGEPVAKGRPRVMRNGITFTPAKTVNYETLVKELYWARYAGHPMLQGQLRMTVRAYWIPPKSASKRKRQAMLQGIDRPTKRPDADNIGKAVADALNGMAYQDDSAIVDLRVLKYWGEIAKVDVEIEELEG